MITYGSTTLTSYNSIVKTEVYYYKSTSATSLSGGSWATTKPTWENGKYIWQKIRTVYEDGTHTESDPVNITGQQGATGTAAYSYKLNSSDSIIGKTKDGEYTIKKITFSATYKQGTGAVSAYNGRFKIESTTNGSTWKTEYTSSGNESSKAFTIPNDIIAIKCSLYQSSGTTVLLDIITVPVVKDGVDAIGLRDSVPYYLASDKDSGITRLTQGWTRYRPQLTAEKKYLWVYYVSRYSEGTTEPELIEIKDDLVHFVNNGDESPVESCVVDIDPVQDLHGYDYPWPAGGGKNKLPNNAVSSTVSNVVYTVNSDGTITANGTSNGWNGLTIATFTLSAGSYIISSGITSGYADRYLETSGAVAVNTNNTGGANSFTLKSDGEITVKFYVRPGYEASNLKIYPMIRLASETDATYAPCSNICPITGWTGAKVTRAGKNLLNPDIKIYINDNMYFGTHSQDIVPDGTFILPAGTYTASASDTMTAIYVYDSSGSHLGVIYNNTKITFTNPKTQPVLIRFYKADTTEQGFLGINMCVELGSTATTYEPYQGDTYDITFPTEAGTVYGGTLDVTSGVLTADRAMVDLGTLTSWRRINNPTSTLSDTYLFVTNLSNAKRAFNGLLSKYKWTRNYIYFTDDCSAGYIYINSIAIRDDRYTDVESFQSAMSGVQLVYELVTPITYQLTPQEIISLLGTNNLWADTGDSDVEYRADTKLYIDNLTRSTEDDMIANANISKDIYFTIGNTLYKASTAISKGETIVPNTNCTIVSLADALNTLAASTGGN